MAVVLVFAHRGVIDDEEWRRIAQVTARSVDALKAMTLVEFVEVWDTEEARRRDQDLGRRRMAYKRATTYTE
jgi:hypothetical protein